MLYYLFLMDHKVANSWGYLSSIHSLYIGISVYQSTYYQSTCINIYILMMLEMSRFPHLCSSMLAVQFCEVRNLRHFLIKNRLFRNIYFSSSKRKKESCKWQLLKRDEISSFLLGTKDKRRSDQISLIYFINCFVALIFKRLPGGEGGG